MKTMATVWPEKEMDASMTCRVGSLQAPLVSVLLCLGYPHPPTTGEWADDRVLMEWRFRDRRGARWTVYDWKGSTEADEFNLGGDGFLCEPAEPDLFRTFLEEAIPGADIALS